MLCYALNYHSGRSSWNHLGRVLGLFRSCQKGKKESKNEEETEEKNMLWKNINIFRVLYQFLSFPFAQAGFTSSKV